MINQEDREGHVLFPSFGQRIARELRPVKELMSAMRSSGTRTLDSIDAQLLLHELYDRSFEISDHRDLRRPLSLVAMQPKESTGPYSRMMRHYRRFAALRIGELFNISIDEFLNRPREQVEWMYRIAEDKTVVEERNNAAIGRALESAINSPEGKRS